MVKRMKTLKNTQGKESSPLLAKVREVTVLLEGERRKLGAFRVFRFRAPRASDPNREHRVGFACLVEGEERYVELFCRDQAEADALAQGIRTGEIVDTTAWPAAWR